MLNDMWCVPKQKVEQQTNPVKCCGNLGQSTQEKPIVVSIVNIWTEIIGYLRRLGDLLGHLQWNLSETDAWRVVKKELKLEMVSSLITGITSNVDHREYEKIHKNFWREIFNRNIKNKREVIKSITETIKPAKSTQALQKS